MRLAPCPSCGRHVLSGSNACPHCAAPLGSAPLRLSASAIALGLVLAAPTACITMKYGDFDTTDTGAALIDADADGFYVNDTDVTLVDCKDDDATIYPGATETPGDSIDSNCDGADDT